MNIAGAARDIRWDSFDLVNEAIRKYVTHFIIKKNIFSIHPFIHLTSKYSPESCKLAIVLFAEKWNRIALHAALGKSLFSLSVHERVYS